jgi:hypothetical protein
MRILHIIASLSPSTGGSVEACLGLWRKIAKRYDKYAGVLWCFKKHLLNPRKAVQRLLWGWAAGHACVKVSMIDTE